MTPAHDIIDLVGGVQAMADLTGVDPSNVHRWTYPKARGGTDGLIPVRHHKRIIDSEAGKAAKLTHNDFFVARTAKKGAA